MKKVLITANIHPYLQNRLEKLGYFVQVKEDIERAELVAIIEVYEVLIITTYTKVDKELIDIARNLKIVGRVGSGMENVDIDYCKQKNIQCVNSPEGNGNAVGEHCLAMLLNLMNNTENQWVLLVMVIQEVLLLKNFVDLKQKFWCMTSTKKHKMILCNRFR